VRPHRGAYANLADKHRSSGSTAEAASQQAAARQGAREMPRVPRAARERDSLLIS
jgi:hypothetical protein